MNAVAVAEVPRGTDDFGGLLRAGETPEDALRRLEKTKGYTKTIGSDDGQRLLAAATNQVKAAPNGGLRGRPRPAAVRETPELPLEGLTCAGSNHVPGHSADCPRYQPPKAAAAQLLEIPLSLVDVAENIRIDAGEISELAASIADLGVLQPIRAIGPDARGRYRAVWGQRRILASIEAGRTTIPALVEAVADVDVPGARRSIEQLAENLQRKDLNPIEEATALRAVLDAEPGLTQEALADKLGRSRPWVSNALRLLTLAEPALDAVRSGKLSASHGRALAGLTPAVQTSIVESGIQQSSHQLEQTISWRTAEADQKRATAERTEKQIPKAIAALEAASVAKDVQIAVSASYNLDNARLTAAIKFAGWGIAGGTYGRGTDAKCDCKAVRLEFERKWVVTPACVDVRHVDRQRNLDQQASKAERELGERRLAVLRSAIAETLSLAALPEPMLRLFWRQARRGAGWYGGPQEEAPADLAKALSEVIATEWILRDVDLAELFASLGLELPQVSG